MNGHVRRGPPQNGPVPPHRARKVRSGSEQVTTRWFSVSKNATTMVSVPGSVKPPLTAVITGAPGALTVQRAETQRRRSDQSSAVTWIPQLPSSPTSVTVTAVSDA